MVLGAAETVHANTNTHMRRPSSDIPHACISVSKGRGEERRKERAYDKGRRRGREGVERLIGHGGLGVRGGRAGSRELCVY